ncbi:MAG TPA: sugar phosphate isomerase/epimerase family protein [Candidatus Brocadiia bacterium]|nr:sugar phosphate isomerase/epimerase family protein [Candidatus Brocadiia bacterium]
MKNPVIMHINYCEQGQTIEETCQKAVRWGFDGVEFRRRRSGAQETPEQYLDVIAKAAKAAGLKHVLFGAPGPDLTQGDEACRRNEVESYIAFYRMAKQRFPGLTVANAMSGTLLNPDKSLPYSDYTRHGSFIATEDQWAWAIEGWKAVGAAGVELGVRFAFETHMCYIHDVPASVRRLCDAIGSPAVGANLDYGNIANFPTPPTLAQSIDLLKDRLYYIHLKNSVILAPGLVYRCPLADGQINNREFLRLLRAINYQGPLCVEAPRGGDREWFAKQDLAYIRSVMADL